MRLRPRFDRYVSNGRSRTWLKIKNQASPAAAPKLTLREARATAAAAKIRTPLLGSCRSSLGTLLVPHLRVASGPPAALRIGRGFFSLFAFPAGAQLGARRAQRPCGSRKEASDPEC